MTPKKSVSEAMTAHVEKAGIDRRQFFIRAIFTDILDSCGAISTNILQNVHADNSAKAPARRTRA